MLKLRTGTATDAAPSPWPPALMTLNSPCGDDSALALTATLKNEMIRQMRNVIFNIDVPRRISSGTDRWRSGCDHRANRSGLITALRPKEDGGHDRTGDAKGGEDNPFAFSRGFGVVVFEDQVRQSRSGISRDL